MASRIWPFPRDDPYPAYREARGRSPVAWDDALGSHLVLSYEPAREVLRGPKWSADPRTSDRLATALDPDGPLSQLRSKSMLFSDPPAHTRLRGSVSRFFSPRTVDTMRSRVKAIANSACAPLADGDSIEVMSEVAYPVPIAVMAELFDIGIEGAQLLREVTPDLAKVLEIDATAEMVEAAAAAATTVMLFLVPLVADRRRQPRDDLLSALIADTGLETDEVLLTCLLLLAAGHETTANLIGNGVLALLELPEVCHRLAEDPDSARSVVEEVLRFDGPVLVTGRVAGEATAVGQMPIDRGDVALVLLGSANHDPASFTDPDIFDSARLGPPHLSFGNGIHFCLGAALARIEAQEVFSAMARWLATSGLTDPPPRRASSQTFRRLTELPVRSR